MGPEHLPRLFLTVPYFFILYYVPEINSTTLLGLDSGGCQGNDRRDRPPNPNLKQACAVSGAFGVWGQFGV